MAMNQSCYGIRGADGRGDYFSYFLIRNEVADLQQNTHGSVFDTITRNTFKGIDVIIPPRDLTLAYDESVAPILEKIHANLMQSRTLTALRDALLPKLISGDIRVGGAEGVAAPSA